MKTTPALYNTETQPTNQPIKKTLIKHRIQPQPDIVTPEKAIFLKKENLATRYLKVNPLYRPSSDTLRKPGKTVPQLRLSGDWLQAAGFNIGDYISVTVMDGLLVLRPVSVEDTVG